MIDFRLLRSFLTVAEELHFGRAAQRLHITQPPLTRQIQQLEELLGDVTLFERSNRSVALTEAGHTLAIETRQLLSQLDRAIAHTQRAARGEAGTLRIGFASTADYSILPPLLKSFCRQYPDINLDLLEHTEDEQLRLLGQNNLDLGILVNSSPPFDSISLHSEPVVAALPESHPLASGKGRLPIKSLREEPFVLFPRNRAPELYDRLIAYTQAASFSPRIVQEARQMQTIVSLVAGGLGVSLVPKSMQTMRRKDVVYRDLTPKAPIVHTSLAWPDATPQGALASFIRVAKEFRRNNAAQ